MYLRLRGVVPAVGVVLAGQGGLDAGGVEEAAQLLLLALPQTVDDAAGLLLLLHSHTHTHTHTHTRTRTYAHARGCGECASNTDGLVREINGLNERRRGRRGER